MARTCCICGGKISFMEGAPFMGEKACLQCSANLFYLESSKKLEEVQNSIEYFKPFLQNRRTPEGIKAEISSRVSRSRERFKSEIKRQQAEPILTKNVRALQSVDDDRLSIAKLYRRECTERGMTVYPFHFEHSNLWLANDTLCIAEDEEAYLSHYSHGGTQPRPINIKEIQIDKIQYYTKEGDVQYTTKISGGGGGGSSLGGAIVGGLIAGGAGAVIGSRQKIKPITAETRTHDSRQTVLRYYNDFGKLEVMTFKGFNIYDFLLGEIPDKDLVTIQLGQSNHSHATSSEVPSSEAGGINPKLIKLQELYLDGQITLDEYKIQRKKILNKQ